MYKITNIKICKNTLELARFGIISVVSRIVDLGTCTASYDAEERDRLPFKFSVISIFIQNILNYLKLLLWNMIQSAGRFAMIIYKGGPETHD